METSYWVENSTLEAARIDAENLVDSPGVPAWDASSDEIELTRMVPRKGQQFWTGGPHGCWKER